MDANLIETLLWKPENDTLDFKREQYPLSSKDEKGELIKDILAFANSWKTSDAYILVGVDEKPGGRGSVCGVTHHLAESNLQQMVNSKTNRPVRFEYIPTQVDGQDVGVIKIRHKQDRPLYVLKGIGRLKANAVYVRRGSSTAVAGDDEVAQMVRFASLQEPDPIVAVEFADEHGVRLGTSVRVTSRVLIPLHRPVPPMQSSSPEPRVHGLEAGLSRMYPELAVARLADPMEGSPGERRQYRKETALLTPVLLSAKNHSSTTARDVRVLWRLRKASGVRVLAEDSYPEKPRGAMGLLMRGVVLPHKRDLVVRDQGHQWEVEAHLGKIQPKDEVHTHDRLFVGSEQPITLEAEASVLADNLGDPINPTLSISIDAVEEEVPADDLEAPLSRSRSDDEDD